ncbi:serine/threonine-protein kinase 10-like isoform X2 [Syngnathoides biaculeatus]|uniref:serine/threonine-protein kinase 10-like isoform X2 n=1 Tax=Syngnathoides biaculeatus TaxID=300417 RepID=UPI002ADE05D5|nr:serine/threonine-protein kinase 10-like isoform X2 [Syngnathoides biaculeatus]
MVTISRSALSCRRMSSWGRGGGSGRRLPDDARKAPEPSVVAQAESEDFQEFSPTRLGRSGSRLDAALAGCVSATSGTKPNQRSWAEEQQETARSPRLRGAGDGMTSLDDIIAPPPRFRDPSDGDRSESEEASSARGSSSSSSRMAGRECGSAPLPADGVVSLRPYVTHVIQRRLLDWRASAQSNRGFLLHHQLRPVTGRYREGREYAVLHHIHSGAYGDVVRVRDCSTRFTCAAKKVPASRFREEELTSWSLAAASSPRVVRLFGAVLEGPHVVLFMDLKPASLAQLLAASGALPRDLALHYLWQTLGALQHLHHRNVLHLDVKADNVLLSADLSKSFLCDFGLSRVLADSERSAKGIMAASLAGTETHMAPEVALGAGASAKADVWSVCCMLLHLLNGRQPWLGRYAPPLCLHIATQPAPLWEVPPGCDRATRRVFRGGLRKDPRRRDSAGRLRGKTAIALKAAGGLNGASIRRAREKLYGSGTAKARLLEPAAGLSPAICWVSPWRTRAAHEDDDEDPEEEDEDPEEEDDDEDPEEEDDDEDPEEEDDDEDPEEEDDDEDPEEDDDEDPEEDDDEDPEEEDDDEDPEEDDAYVGEEDALYGEYEGDCEDEGEEASARYLRDLLEVFPLLRRGRQTGGAWGGSDGQLEELRDGAVLRGDTRTPSPEPRDHPPSCFSSSSRASDSERSSDDVSSGVPSSCGRLVKSSALARDPPSPGFEASGVDVWIEDARGERVRIRERQRVRVGHVAVGIGRQVTSALEPRETCRQQRQSRRAPSPWRHWTGSRCPSGGRSASHLCGSGAWPRLTRVRDGPGEFETANWKSDNDPDPREPWRRAASPSAVGKRGVGR